MEEQDQPAPGIFEKAANMLEVPEDAKPEITVDPKQFGIDLTDHNPEAEAVRSADEKDGVAAPGELPHPHTRIQNIAALQDPVGKMKDILDPFRDNFTIGPVEVTIAEKDQFVRSALHDEEMVFEVPLEGLDATAKVAIPPEAYTAMVAEIIDRWDAEGVVNAKNNVSWLLLFQQLHAWYQIREFGGKPTKWASFFDDGVPKLSEIRKMVSNFDTFDPVVNMSAPRWRMMVNALALAEFKYKMCLDAWRTRAFFAKAGTA